jgi:putative DNA primase/helicase
MPPTPAYFSPNALEYDFDIGAPPPRQWLEFLGRLFPEDPQSIELIQEFFGYALTQDTRQQKMLLIVGPRRSGKGTIGRVLTELVGRSNTCAPSPSSLASEFGLQALLGKTLAIVGDARLSHRTDLALVTERLLSITGEDWLTVNQKYKAPIVAKLGTRIVICTNELPKLSDASAALASRFMILRLTQSWLGREDPELTDKLLVELPGILLWAIEGWRRLQERGCFVQPGSGRELVEELDGLSSPVRQFVRDRCVLDPSSRIIISDLYAAWCAWCSENGRRECGTTQSFGRDILAAVPGIRRIRLGAGLYPDGPRPWAYVGIALWSASNRAG